MTALTSMLQKGERVELYLRRLFESFGYKKYRMSKFENYDLYAENKSFLKNESIITFHDLSGKLMALKPDVTLSIVKNAKGASAEKYYYVDKVFRLQSQNREYREIAQMGLEYIGLIGLFETAEVVSLALESLSAIERDYVLEFSHMGFVEGLLAGEGVTGELREQVLTALSQKNVDEITLLCSRAGLSSEQVERVAALATLGGSYAETLAKARGISRTLETKAALSELGVLFELLDELKLSSNLRLDFSITNSVDYYNGLIFNGYVEGLPRAVLSGGRYDNLLRRFGRSTSAIGFALYLDEVERALREPKDYDVDYLILHEEGEDSAGLFRACRKLIDQGYTVTALRKRPEGLRCKKICRFQDGVLKEETVC